MGQRPPLDQSRRLVLNGTEGVVGQCRDFVRRTLTEWSWASRDADADTADAADAADAAEAVDDVLLLVSEVVANACLHGGGPRALQLHRAGPRLRIEVTDNSPVAPTVRPRPDPSLPGGHGMLIVERLAREWGSVPVDGGKCVWLEVSSPPWSGDGDGGRPRAGWLGFLSGRGPGWPSD
ncbi:ATP-binding protein [Streptomyces sp. NPDC048340]|uniref:ATP-binding protein n=1 Tax=Streptomyces sp. NPDC048340 TaxID=3365537 RepID=UPI0037185497